MAKRRINTRLPKGEVTKLYRDLPAMLEGKKPSRFGLHRLFWGAVAYSLFQSIHDAFMVKAYGLPDELGNQWDDLDEKYKAYGRPLDQGSLTKLPENLRRRLKNNANSGVLGLLTPGQYKAWKKVFGTIYHASKAKMPDGEAKALAGQIAWTRAKAAGAKTKLEVLGNRDLLILRVSDTLSESLSPGKFDPLTGYNKSSKYQIFTIRRGSLEIGTRVHYANMVSRRNNQDFRPVWPEEMGPWIDKAVDFGMDTVLEKIESILI